MKSFGALLATRVLLGFSEGGTLVSRDIHTVIGLELTLHKISRAWFIFSLEYVGI